MTHIVVYVFMGRVPKHFTQMLIGGVPTCAHLFCSSGTVVGIALMLICFRSTLTVFYITSWVGIHTPLHFARVMGGVHLHLRFYYFCICSFIDNKKERLTGRMFSIMVMSELL